MTALPNPVFGEIQESDDPDVARFHRKQGQYLAFIYNYTVMNGRPPGRGGFAEIL